MIENSETLKIQKIKAGSVIDHITAGKALAVLQILKISGNEPNSVSILMNVPSKTFKKKDLLKIENRELTQMEVNQISLISSSATINIIRDYKVAKKMIVKPPKEITGIVPCENPSCITNSNEPADPTFSIQETEPIILKCNYCGRYTTEDFIIRYFQEKK
ncbi:MAG: aspartate carbamoyltransferase regulatory subunit [Candidatus Ranarchaeia archaeon]